MTTGQTRHPVRQMRADARRNRERVLQAARAVFAEDGANASLNKIAQRAEVGAGTLYRHFPTRDALIEAVYRSEVEKLAVHQKRLAATLPPLDALRAWMNLFIDHVAAKALIIPLMETVAGGSARLIEGSRSLIHAAFTASVKRASAQRFAAAFWAIPFAAPRSNFERGQRHPNFQAAVPARVQAHHCATPYRLRWVSGVFC